MFDLIFQYFKIYLTTDFTDFYGFDYENFWVASSRFVQMSCRCRQASVSMGTCAF